ncbi:MAG: hypothetical protein LBS31_05275, partial [Candidatus Adiutrix sp.]|nr:hypothetical protein [Candidatus Adiutrix sp.]
MARLVGLTLDEVEFLSEFSHNIHHVFRNRRCCQQIKMSGVKTNELSGQATAYSAEIGHRDRQNRTPFPA